MTTEKTRMHPRTYSTTDIGRKSDELLADIARTTDYRAIDQYERLVRVAIVDLVPLRRPGDGGIYHDREEIELGLSYARHAVSGRWSYRLSETAGRTLLEGTRMSPPPLVAVAPVYLEFEGDTIEYAEGRMLRAAYVSRGEVGAITFLSEPASRRTRGDAMTALLPNILRLQDILSLPESRLEDLPTDDEDVVERTMRQLGGKGPTGELAALALLNERLSECTFRRDEWPEVSLAAAFVLSCAARVAEVDERYGAPAYRQDDAISRNWLENGEHPDREMLAERERRWRAGDDLLVDVA